MRSLLVGSEEGYKSNHPFFVDTPYRLPSGVEVTDNSISRPAATEVKLKSEVEQETSDSEKLKAELSETRSLMEDCLAENESLNSCLLAVENSASSAIKDFKESGEYVDLLKGNTATLLRDFCQKGLIEVSGDILPLPGVRCWTGG
ncbi:hypothetical protein LIER_21748 [Lithospermum erythrorhizon]|uniref:Uncharacterized protein n=1 Tax=Lithospermum erythrorhizon TaxID=34254 RepID=A0AAV3QTS4_LITER